MRKPKTIGVGYASLLERLSQTGSGLLSDCAPCGLLECRAHRLPADQQGHRQSPAPAAHRRRDPKGFLVAAYLLEIAALGATFEDLERAALGIDHVYRARTEYL